MGGKSIFEARWIDLEYNGEWWDTHIEWNPDASGVPDLTDCSEWELDEIYETIWRDACDLGTKTGTA